MNGKKAKAVRKAEEQAKQERLEWQAKLRQMSTPPARVVTLEDLKQHSKPVDHDTPSHTTKKVACLAAIADAEFERLDPQSFIKLRRAEKELAVVKTPEEIEQLHASVNGPEHYAKLGSVGYKLTDMHGDKGVICRVLSDEE